MPSEASVQSPHFPPPGSSPPAACGVCASTYLAAFLDAESSPWCAGPKLRFVVGQDRRQALRSPGPGCVAFAFASFANARSRSRRCSTLQALLVSTGTVALAEIGDKTQLLALLLAARFRKPWPIAFGILAATRHQSRDLGLAGRRTVPVVVAGSPALGRRGQLPGRRLVDAEAGQAGRRRATAGARRVHRHHHRILPGRDRRQDPGRHGAAGRPNTRRSGRSSPAPPWACWPANLPVVWLGHRFADRLPLKLARSVRRSRCSWAWPCGSRWRGIG